jgi:CHAT domain-containing protein
MKKLLFLLLILNSISANTQTIKEIAQVFWEATDSGNNPIIVEKGEQLINLIEKNNLKIDSTIIRIRLWTALGYSNMGNYIRSRDLNLQTIEISEKVFGKEHPDYAKSLNNLAFNYSQLGDYSKSKELNQQCLIIYEKLFGKEHTNYLRSLNYLALNYSNLGDYSKSKELNEQCLIINEKRYGKEHPDYVRSLNNLASNYSQLGDYSKSKELNEQCLIIYEKLFGRENHNYARSLGNLAFNYSQLGDYSKSKELNEQCLIIYEKLFGKEHPDYVRNLSNLALNYSQLGDYSKSKELNEQCLIIYEKLFGNEHPNFALSLGNLASDYSELGDYSKSKELNEQCLIIYEKLYGKENPDYAISLSNLASSYSKLGDYSKSKELNEQCLIIYEKLLGNEHPNFALSLGNLASDYSQLGDYSKSKELNEKCLIIYEKLFGKEHPSYAASLNSLARNYSELGDYLKSKELNEQCLIFYEKLYGKEHPRYAASLSNLAFSCYKLGDYFKSKELNEQCLIINEKILGKDHPYYATVLNNLALNHSKLGDYTKSKELNYECLRIYEIFYGKEHPYYAKSLNNIAWNYTDLGNYNKALDYNLLALKIYEKAVGKEHPDYALSLNNIAANYAKLDDYNNALQFFTQSLDVSINSFSKNKFSLSPAIQSSYKKTIELSIQHLASLSCIESSKISTLHNKWLGINGIIGSDQVQLRRRIELSKDEVLIALFDEIATSQFQLTKYNELTLVERKEKESQIILLEKQITELQSKLNNYSIGFSEMNRIFAYRDEANNLNDNEVLVDIMRFPYYDFKSNIWSDSIKYLVFISSSKDSVADYVYFHKGKELEEINFENYKYQATNVDNKTELKDTSFYNSFWKPIADKIGDAKTIYVSLGGVYNNINLNTLYNPETGKYLLEEKDIRIVNSARDFVLSKEQEKKIYTTNTASLFGFPDFNGNTTVAVDSTDFLASTRDLNSFWLDSLTRGGLKANPLPATKIEVENISLTLKLKGWQVNSYLVENASETNIKKQESPRILHIATHGYFFPDIPIDKENTRFLGMDRQQVVQDPMLRSGLLFTGANRTLKGEESKGENGLLSAAEAALLDLRETELVVLSACETGKGEVKNSEGVYGLRKAFSDAGAKNIIMSLWKVDDKVTQEFMSRFYEIWLNDKTSIREAFNKTQLEIKAKYPEPYYWGAFILVGE